MHIVGRYLFFVLALQVVLVSCSKEEESIKTDYKLKEERFLSSVNTANSSEQKITYSYNSRGLVKTKTYSFDGSFWSKQSDFIYNNEGKALSYTLYGDHGTPDKDTCYITYDSEGRKLKEEYAYSHFWITWEYDNLGRLINFKNAEGTEWKNYEYDENNNVSYYEEHNWVSEYLMAKVTITYFSSNLMETEIKEYYNIYNITNKRTWQYNTNGTIRSILSESKEVTEPDTNYRKDYINKNYIYDDFDNPLHHELYNYFGLDRDEEKLSDTYNAVYGVVELKD